MNNITSDTIVTLTLNGADFQLKWSELISSLIRVSCDNGYCSTEIAKSASLDIFWLIFGAVMVFLMQAGFTLLELGSVHVKNTKNILTKNLGDTIIGAICFYFVGYGLAFVDGNSFIGDAGFAIKGDHFFDSAKEFGQLYKGYNYAFWLFQWAFAATAATIVSGAVAERVSFVAYFAYSFLLTIFVYPVVAHWAWSSTGWASAFKTEDKLFDVGVIDFAGSGVVHITGGVASLIGCYILGPRSGRFDGNGFAVEMPKQSIAFQTIGAMLLWFGWYGFNCVSTLTLAGNFADVAGKTAVTTTISAATSGIATVIWGKLFGRKVICPSLANNGILAGLVGITAGCSTCEPEGALVIGFVSSIVYFTLSKLLIRLQIDDVVDAVPVHLGCGIWGVIAAAIFATGDNYTMAYGGTSCGIFYTCEGSQGKQFGANLVFALAVIAWVGSCSLILFLTLKHFNLLRVSLEVEAIGLDHSEHGGCVYYQPDHKLAVRPAGDFSSTHAEPYKSVNTPSADRA